MPLGHTLTESIYIYIYIYTLQKQFLGLLANPNHSCYKSYRNNGTQQYVNLYVGITMIMERRQALII